MVDVGVPALTHTSRVSPANASPLRRLAVRVSGDLAGYEALARDATFAPAQDATWLRAWFASLGAEALAVVLYDRNRAVLGLALEVVRSGPFRIARLAGGAHANGNFPPLTRSDADAPLASFVQALPRLLADARPGIDLLMLERLVPRWQGRTNPFMALRHTPSPNVALAIDLSPGFNGVLDRSHGARRRKRYRYQTRRFSEVGAIRRIRPANAKEAIAVVNAFFSMKGERLRRMGIADTFADEPVRAFFRRLFSDAAETPKPLFRLDALEVAGKLRAITGSSVSGDRLICDFAAIADDDLTGYSPGDYLFYGNIEEACHEGFATYDFGVGDEPYKRHWCDLETRHFDVRIPLNAKGRLLAAMLDGEAALKTTIKRSPVLWRILKRLRGALRGSAAV